MIAYATHEPTYTIASFFVLLCALFAAFSTTLEPLHQHDIIRLTASHGIEQQVSQALHCIKEAESHSQTRGHRRISHG